MRKAIEFQGGRVMDPSQEWDDVRPLRVLDGVLVDSFPDDVQASVVDVSGLLVVPGLIDLHVHLREPGQTTKETIASGSRSAAAGGFTTIVAMPNTSPVVDGVDTVSWIRQRAKEKAVVRVHTTACISNGMEGKTLAPIGSLAKAGAVAITDDGKCIQNNELMRRALEYASMFDIPVFDHCQDNDLSADGVMNEGYWSTLLGLPGWPPIAEEIMIARNALLSELTGARIHCQHVTTSGGIRILKEAQQRGVPISGEVCPHHLALTHEALQTYDSNFKMNPPLRTQRDVEALREGIRDGVIDYLASDHAPHCTYEKERELDQAPFGILGLETELSVFMEELVHPGVIGMDQLLAKMTINPARLMGLDAGTLQTGKPADITVIDPDLEWTVDKEKFCSKSRNTPFHGKTLKGRAVMTWVAGELVWSVKEGIVSK